MIYLDNGATSLDKPECVARAVAEAVRTCANPGRGGYPAAMKAAHVVYQCRETCAVMMDCEPEQVVFTGSCTQGLNLALRSLVKPGGRVVISGFEHNAVTRTLHGLGAQITVAGRRLFDWQNTLESFETALKAGPEAAVFLHVSNVFGYILPVEELAKLCQQYRVPFVVDVAQSAGVYPVSLKKWGAAYIAMPGHKGLLGPQGTGILLCGDRPDPLCFGGTGSESIRQEMPELLPDRLEAGTLNVPGIAGLNQGLQYLRKTGLETVREREYRQMRRCVRGLKRLGFTVYSGEHQGGTVSFVPGMDCEEAAQRLAEWGIAVRAGLHCAPLAHESAGTLKTGTVRVSFGIRASDDQTDLFLHNAEKCLL